MNLESCKNELSLSPSYVGARLLTLEDILNLDILANPDNKKLLRLFKRSDSTKLISEILDFELCVNLALTCGEFNFPILNGGG
jgi:hypothetical protein